MIQSLENLRRGQEKKMKKNGKQYQYDPERSETTTHRSLTWKFQKSRETDEDRKQWTKQINNKNKILNIKENRQKNEIKTNKQTQKPTSFHGSGVVSKPEPRSELGDLHHTCNRAVPSVVLILASWYGGLGPESSASSFLFFPQWLSHISLLYLCIALPVVWHLRQRQPAAAPCPVTVGPSWHLHSLLCPTLPAHLSLLSSHWEQGVRSAVGWLTGQSLLQRSQRLLGDHFFLLSCHWEQGRRSGAVSLSTFTAAAVVPHLVSRGSS